MLRLEFSLFPMLRFLRIKRLAVIDAVEVEFEPGLNVLTGETGAGKSILVEAVGLLLGGRASGDLVRTGEEAATIEAIFESPVAVRAARSCWFAAKSPRRAEAAPSSTANWRRPARSRNCPARLIELHGQHEHQTLLDPATHLDVARRVRRTSSGRPRRSPTPSSDGASAAKNCRGSRKAVAEREARQDLVAFQLAELDRAAIASADEDAGAGGNQTGARECRAGRAAVRGKLRVAVRERRRGRCPASDRCGVAWRSWRRSTPRFQPYVDARDGIKSQLEDLALFLRRYADGIEASPARLQQVEERLALLERLKRKYGPALADVHCQARRRCGPRSRISKAAISGLPTSSASAPRRVRLIWLRLGRLQRSGVAWPRRFARGMETLARRAGHGADPIRGPFRRAISGKRVDAHRHRCRRVLRLAESRRGAPAARTHRLRRRALAPDAGDEDA